MGLDLTQGVRFNTNLPIAENSDQGLAYLRTAAKTLERDVKTLGTDVKTLETWVW